MTERKINVMRKILLVIPLVLIMLSCKKDNDPESSNSKVSINEANIVGKWEYKDASNPELNEVLILYSDKSFSYFSRDINIEKAECKKTEYNISEHRVLEHKVLEPGVLVFTLPGVEGGDPFAYSLWVSYNKQYDEEEGSLGVFSIGYIQSLTKNKMVICRGDYALIYPDILVYKYVEYEFIKVE